MKRAEAAHKPAWPKLAGYLVKWLIFAAIWFLFVYQASVWEALAAAGAAALTLFSVEKARRYEPLRFQPRAHWVAQAWRLPKPIFTDTWTLIRALARCLEGKPSRALFQLVPFQSPAKGPRGAAQRGLAVLYASTPPNFIFVEYDSEGRYLMAHQVEKSPVPRMIREIEKR
ncbi:MAG: hypothetical protein ACRD4O_03435 [Bryobacteraceae bacterium]